MYGKRGYFDDKLVLQNLQNKKIEKLSVSCICCCVLTKSKELFVFGENRYKQFGNGNNNFKVFTKIELEKNIIENIVDIKTGLYNTILILKGNQFYICGKSTVFGDYSKFTKLDINSIDPTLNAVQNCRKCFIFYRNYSSSGKRSDNEIVATMN
ncbi:hypothetical protein ABK040_003474 [Willaertia magna]